jgi:inosine-uridine nucleoside N-ribohydrolase
MREKLCVKRLALLILSAFLAACGMSAASSQKIPLILDTDIGTDIDDAFALALILESPELDLQGVTTVSGDTQARARIAARMLWEAGQRQVPVCAGEPGKPLPIEQAHWVEGFSSPQLRHEKAVDFLCAEVNRQPGQLILLAIGPLTNVGTLLKQHPEAARKIKRLAMMGGSIARGYEPGSPPTAEYNIAQDPAAAQIVFTSGIPILMVPLDATAMLQLDAANRHRVFAHLSPLTDALTILYHLWNQPTPTLFDPMAVAILFHPTLCETKELAIEVDGKGFTRVAEGKTTNSTVALSTDPARFFQLYLSRVAP